MHMIKKSADFEHMEKDFHFFWKPDELSLPNLQPSDSKGSVLRAKKVLAAIIHDITTLEGNPFTLEEVQSLINGITVSGRRVSDTEQVLNQKASLQLLFDLVESNSFAVDKSIGLQLQSLAAKGEALEEGVFRTGKVGIKGTAYQPPTQGLERTFDAMVEAHVRIENPIEKGIVTFLCVARNQMFWDGNKRTGRLLMNGILLTAGQEMITIPEREHNNFNKMMISFYETGNGTEMINFLSHLQIRYRLD